MLEPSGVPVSELREHVAEAPDDTLQLHEISALLIQEGNLDSLYSRILNAAMSLMSSDIRHEADIARLSSNVRYWG